MNFSKNKILSILILFIIFTPSSYTEEIKEETKQKKIERKNKQDNKKDTSQPAEFIPTEKIKSDSFVSFPVDI